MSLSIQNNAVRQQNYMNNKQVNFKGVYILKGVAKDIVLASNKIRIQCSFDSASIFHPERKSAVRTLWLAPKFSDEQQNLKQLIATNEHTPNVRNYNRKYRPVQNRLRPNLSNEELLQYSFFNLLRQIMAPYKYAEASSKKRNEEPMCDFMIDQYLKMKKCLEQFKEVSTVPMGEIKELDALDVLKAIKEGRFNFITGEIRNI